MNKKDLEYFKKRLMEERTVLENELKTIGHKNPHASGGWEAEAKDMDIDSADDNEVADKMEELEGHSSILVQLEKQLEEVEAAVDRIKNNTYGICEVSKEPIERERLAANPSARTCLAHMNSQNKKPRVKTRPR